MTKTDRSEIYACAKLGGNIFFFYYLITLSFTSEIIYITFYSVGSLILMHIGWSKISGEIFNIGIGILNKLFLSEKALVKKNIWKVHWKLTYKLYYASFHGTYSTIKKKKIFFFPSLLPPFKILPHSFRQSCICSLM